MGDRKRFRVFADFLAEHFEPERHPRVADVAGGCGRLAVELKKRGYERIWVIDPRAPRGNPWHERREFLGAEDPIQVDLVVGMHPDEATLLILEYAATGGKAKAGPVPFAVCPCCYPSELARYGFRSWVRLQAGLVERTHQWWVTRLRMRGRNVVLFGIPRKESRAFPTSSRPDLNSESKIEMVASPS